MRRFLPVFFALALVFSFPTLASADHGDLVLKVNGEPIERIDGHEYPETFDHIMDAINEGHPSTCTIDRDGAEDRRDEALEDYPPDADKGDRDEFPMAMCEEGGEGASVRYVDPSDNRGMGATIGNALEDYKDGTKVKFVIVPDENSDNSGKEEDSTDGNDSDKEENSADNGVKEDQDNKQDKNKQEGGPMPDTAGENPLGVLIGSVVAVIGGLMLWLRRKWA